jgi:YHS domain-containing protein/thioredoxin-related protein
MGKVRWFLPVLLLSVFTREAVIAQQPIHWEATIDSAKAAASQSHRLVLVLFSAPWCTACHHLESDIRNQQGAAAALEANFVPVKVNYDYYPNTAKQYGVTRLPTTVILVPTARGEVLAVIPESMPVDEYLLKLNKVVADAKRRDAGVFAQIPANPAVGNPAILKPAATIAPAIVDNSSVPTTVAPGQPLANSQSSFPPLASPAPGVGGPFAVQAGPALSRDPAVDPQKFVPMAKLPAPPPVGLDGYCPVQLVESAHWQRGKKDWGVIHRGRTYLFAGPEEQNRFRADPDRYAPVNSGNDVVLSLEQGRSVAGYRQHGAQFDGHVYLFASESTLEKFHSNPHYYADRALQAMRSTGQQAAAVR